MTSVNFDLGSFGTTPIGLGWWLAPIAGTTAWWHGGGSPGGGSVLVVLPETDLVIAAFGNGAAAYSVLDVAVNTAIECVTGGKVASTIPSDPAGFEAWRCTGSFASHQFCQHVELKDDGLIVRSEFQPMDADHAAALAAFSGTIEPSPPPPPPYELVPVGPALCKPKDMPDDSLTGLIGRMNLAFFNTPDEDGRFRFDTECSGRRGDCAIKHRRQ